MTATIETLAEAVRTDDIGWSRDTAELCRRYKRLFTDKSAAAGEMRDHFPPGWADEWEDGVAGLLDEAESYILANDYQRQREDPGLFPQWIHAAHDNTLDRRAAGVIITALAELHGPVSVAETVTSVVVLPDLEPLPLMAATVADDVPDGGEDDEPADPDDDAGVPDDAEVDNDDPEVA